MPDMWTNRAVTPEEAVASVANGTRIFVHGAASRRLVLASRADSA
jgi:hypothetical protein